MRHYSDFKGEGVTLRLNFRSKGNVFLIGANIYEPLDGGMAVLQLCRLQLSRKETL